MKYDVVIIGAGPAGTTAASLLASNGITVLILDKKQFPRNKTCGGLVTDKAISLLSFKLGISTINEIIDYKASSFSLYDKNNFINSAEVSTNINFVTRNKFDHYLLNNATEQGAHLILGVKPYILDNTKLKVNDEIIYFDYLIGADGANSYIRKAIGKTLNKENIALGLQVDVSVNYIWNTDLINVPSIYFGYINYGWAWVFPKNDYLSIGIAGLGVNAKRLHNILYEFLLDLHISHDNIVKHIKGAMIPYGSYIATPASDNFFLVGDAAGFVDPITGEGIYYAILSGIFAAGAILKQGSRPESIYNKECKQHIIRIIRQGVFSRYFFFQQPFYNYAMKKLSGNKKHMVRFAKVLSGEIDYMGYFKSTIKSKFLGI